MSLERALALGCRYVGRRERTEHELREHLAGRLDDLAAVEEAVAEMCELGLVDDARYARLYCEDKLSLSGWGAERIRAGLRARGIERELIERTLAEAIGGAESEHERAFRLLRERFPGPPLDARERERGLGFLLRKGYDSETALDAVRAWGRCQ